MAPNCRIHHGRLDKNIAYGPLISLSSEGHMVDFEKENSASRRLAQSTAPLSLGHGYLQHLHKAHI